MGKELRSHSRLGGVQALVLLLLSRMENEAYGLKVLEELEDLYGERVDHAQVYSTVRRLKSAGYIVEAGRLESDVGGPPKKILALTEAGQEALADAREYYVEMGRVLSGAAVEVGPETERSERG